VYCEFAILVYTECFVNVAQQWILSPEPSTEDHQVVLIEELLISQEFADAENQVLHLRRALVVSPDEVRRIERLTSGQRGNPLWPSIRKLRFTASNFGPLLHAAVTRR